MSFFFSYRIDFRFIFTFKDHTIALIILKLLSKIEKVTILILIFAISATFFVLVKYSQYILVGSVTAQKDTL